jgi:hypothetical protein
MSNRRKFIMLFGGAAAWPLVVHAERAISKRGSLS